MKTKCSSRMKALLLVLAMVLSLFCVSIGTAHPRFLLGFQGDCLGG